MESFVFAGLIGIIAGLRTMTAPAAVSWAASLGWLNVADTSLAFMGYTYAPFILSALAIGELITDKLPTTPSRKVPVQFAARLVSGALSGGCLGVAHDALLAGVIGAVIGAVIGTLGGAALRHRLAGAFGKDLPAALCEDAIALMGALVVVTLAT